MQKLFEFVEHLGKFRVLVQTRDIQNGAVTTAKITDGAVTTEKIGDKEVKSVNIGDGAVTNEKIGDNEVKNRHIAPGAVTNEKLADECITGDEIEADTVKNGKLADDAVQTRNIKNRNVTGSKIAQECISPEHLHKSFVPGVIRPITDDLQNQIDSLETAGLALSNEFGDDPHIGVSQKTLTDAINRIWQELEDITGEAYRGINMVVTPTYFISEDGGTIHAAANTSTTSGIFERIQFFVDEELVYEAFNTPYVAFAHDLEIKPTYDYVIMCKAKIMGIEYTRQQVITRYNEFYIGAGSVYTDIMDSAHAKQLNGTMRHNYDVTFEDDQKLIIVMGASLRDAFIRADLNGAEIQFTESTVTIDEKEYAVLISDNWSAGDYNIDING